MWEMRPGKPGRFLVQCAHHDWRVEDISKDEANALSARHLRDHDATDPCWARVWADWDAEDRPYVQARCAHHNWSGPRYDAEGDVSGADSDADGHNAERERQLHPERFITA